MKTPILTCFAAIILGALAVFWGTWVLITDQPSKHATQTLRMCSSTFTDVRSRSDCSFNGSTTAENLRNNAIKAVVIGGAAASIGWFVLNRPSPYARSKE